MDEENISTLISSAIESFPKSELLRLYDANLDESQTNIDPVKINQELKELFPGNSLMDNYFIEHFKQYE